MSAHALHVPERPHVLRWTLASFAIVLAHATAAAALVAWYQRTPPEQPLIPAIMVSLAPAVPAVVEQSDAPVAEQKVEQIEDTPPDPPKVEEPKIEEAKVEQPPEKVAPPPRPAVIALPKREPKRVEQRKKLAERRLRPQEERAPAATPVVARQSSVAVSNAYASLVYGHLQRFKSYPASANGASGNVVARFVLNRSGHVLSASIVKSSGNAALDAEALATVRRASPFPPFPEEKTVSQDTVTAPMSFSR